LNHHDGDTARNKKAHKKQDLIYDSSLLVWSLVRSKMAELFPHVFNDLFSKCRAGQGTRSLYTYRSFYHRDQPERRIAIIDGDVASSIAKLGERGALVEGDMVGPNAFDLILRSVRARMMGVALVVEVAGVDADDRAADATSLGIPAHAIMDLEALRHGRPLWCRRRTAKEAVLALDAYLPLAALAFQPPRSRRFPEIVTFCGQFALLNLESRA
jgi:hypothetical protein